MEKVLTEAELTELHRDDMRYSTFAADKQDGIINTFGPINVVLTPEVLDGIGKSIEEWIDEKSESPYLAFTVKTKDDNKFEVSFDKYVVNFQSARNTIEQWVIVKCRQLGYPKFHTRWLQGIQLPADCFQYKAVEDGQDEEMYPNVFNLLTHRTTSSTRKHSSALQDEARLTNDATDKQEVCG